MDDTFLADLRAKAEAATPGPWEHKGRSICAYPEKANLMFVVANGAYYRNAAFIAAANPATILALLDEIAALRAEREWRPIETAPKDGTRILLAKFVGHPANPSALWWVGMGFWSAKWKNWNDGIEPYADPTHWMPLPTPPEPKP